MILSNILKWIEKDILPTRILLSGPGSNIDTAIAIAAKLQNVSPEIIEKGIYSDVVVFRDKGKSFKIDWSDAAKKDDQGEYENVRGLIKWAHQKPIEGKFRIIILENLERLSDVSPHACLKLIEEPPTNTRFIFTTQNHHHRQILDTIISRVTVIRIPKKESDFEILDEIKFFLESSNLIQKFQMIDDLDKESKNNKEKKIDRTVFFNFLQDLLQHARFFNKYHPFLELILETHNAIKQNTNPRLTLERLAIKITN